MYAVESGGSIGGLHRPISVNCLLLRFCVSRVLCTNPGVPFTRRLGPKFGSGRTKILSVKKRTITNDKTDSSVP